MADDMGPTERAYQRGRTAFQNGKNSDTNPWWAAQHPNHSQHELWEAWDEGWNDARDHSED